MVLFSQEGSERFHPVKRVIIYTSSQEGTQWFHLIKRVTH